MAATCDVCGKGPGFGNSISHSHRRTRRRWNPNIQTVHAVVDGGRWLNNPFGSDSCGTGCVSRPGIGDVDAGTGLATSWNPTRSRGHGASDLFLDSGGNLWVSSDAPLGSVKCAGVYHPGICEFPAAS
jgi:ribosomal protein L28